MKVLLPMLDERSNRFQFKPETDNNLIINEYTNKNQSNILTFKNKEPYYNDKLQAYVLNFKGRVQEPSIKNFQLVLETDAHVDPIMQFGKVDDNT